MINRGTMRAMRLLTAVQKERPDLLEALTRELFLCVWNKVKKQYDEIDSFE